MGFSDPRELSRLALVKSGLTYEQADKLLNRQSAVAATPVQAPEPPKAEPPAYDGPEDDDEEYGDEDEHDVDEAPEWSDEYQYDEEHPVEDEDVAALGVEPKPPVEVPASVTHVGTGPMPDALQIDQAAVKLLAWPGKYEKAEQQHKAVCPCGECLVFRRARELRALRKDAPVANTVVAAPVLQGYRLLREVARARTTPLSADQRHALQREQQEAPKARPEQHAGVPEFEVVFMARLRVRADDAERARVRAQNTFDPLDATFEIVDVAPVKQ